MSTAIHIAILYSESKRKYLATKQPYISGSEVYDRSKHWSNPYQDGLQIQPHPRQRRSHAAQFRKFKPEIAINLVNPIFYPEYFGFFLE